MKSELRLRRSTDFARVRQQGHVNKHHKMLLSFVKNEREHNRYGFVVSKKVGGAVIRNRVKRRLREAVYQIHPLLQQGYDIVIIARPAIVEQPFTEILRIYSTLCATAKLVEED